MDMVADGKKTESRRRSRVLVVDDDPMMREVMRDQLGSRGHGLSEAENGEAATHLLARQTFDLAIVDLSMPKLDGFGLIRHIRQSPRSVDLPVIVCTSHDDRASIDRAYELGASSFVTKPINWMLFPHHVQFVMRAGATERALRSARAEADTASRMKNGLFHVLSHQLKSPLTSMIGLSDMLGDSLQNRIGAAQADQLAQIGQGARRLNDVIGDILLLSKALSGPDQQKQSEVTASEILDDAMVGLRAAARARGITVSRQPLERDFTICCDSYLMRHAASKLLDNAIKFSPPGSTVEVWAHCRADGSAIISVRDHGPGLAQAKLRDCLKSFAQDDISYGRPAESLGLGLPIAKAICEAHGGDLLIQTAPGAGLLAAIWLPARRVTSQHQAA